MRPLVKIFFAVLILCWVFSAQAQMTTLGAGGSAGGGCSQATAFLTRKSGTTYNSNYIKLICSAVSHGYFNKLDTLYVFATDSSANALLNLVSSNFNATNVGAAFTAAGGGAGGFTGSSSVGIWVDSNFNPTTQAGSSQFQQNSASAFGWSNTAITETAPIFGPVGGVSTVDYIYPNAITGSSFFELNGSSGYTVDVADSTSGLGFYAISRSNSTTVTGYKNGSSVVSSSSDNSVSVVSQDFVFCNGDGATGAGSTRQIMAGGFGANLTPTDQANLYADLHTFLQAVAGITY
jgi:hypothetical protein